MDEFRRQLKEIIDGMLAEGIEPAFLIVDLWGAEYIKQAHGEESLGKFRETAMGAVSQALGDGEAFAYGDYRVVGILPGLPRLKTFSLIQKLQRTLPLLGQGFDCVVRPEFDVVEYSEEKGGIVAVISEFAKRPIHPSARDVA